MLVALNLPFTSHRLVFHCLLQVSGVFCHLGLLPSEVFIGWQSC